MLTTGSAPIRYSWTRSPRTGKGRGLGPVRRIAIVLAASLALAGASSLPGGAQQNPEEPTRERSIAYAAESASAGVTFAITPPGATSPAVGIFGASTQAEITSDVPAAKGKADAIAIASASPVSATTQAPPDSQKSVSSPIPAIPIPGVATVAPLQGRATSVSEADAGQPFTENDASFGFIDIDLLNPTLGPLGTVGGTVEIAKATSFADADAPKDTNVAAAAGTSGTTINVTLNLAVLTSLCAQLPAPVQPTCNQLAERGSSLVTIQIIVGPSSVSCAWDGKEAGCEGTASTAQISIPALGINQTVDPEQRVTIPDADPFLVRVFAGGFREESTSENTDDAQTDQASAIAAGLSVELLGQNRANPGLITLAFGQSTAGVSGEITDREVIARTGGNLLPVLFGGSALIAAGIGIRRFLKRT